MVPEGQVSQVEYLVYVDPQAYHRLENPQDYTEVARWIGQLNKKLEKNTFILLGPGRWGSSDAMQGVPVSYADIFNARALVELAGKKGGYSSEPSYGTHFFQDLVETKIYPLAISEEEPGDRLNLEFIRQAADQMPASSPNQPGQPLHQVIHIPAERPGLPARDCHGWQAGDWVPDAKRIVINPSLSPLAIGANAPSQRSRFPKHPRFSLTGRMSKKTEVFVFFN